MSESYFIFKEAEQSAWASGNAPERARTEIEAHLTALRHALAAMEQACAMLEAEGVKRRIVDEIRHLGYTGRP